MLKRVHWACCEGVSRLEGVETGNWEGLLLGGIVFGSVGRTFCEFVGEMVEGGLAGG